ncbi:hypothetical protein [Adhaeribacter aquaticus]|uniref:hypothetical protein n=1 Tax=Adhaeribacter aquaticus TaxID=299567 RepID=UPI0004015EB5|nr:hypothetical protein [Adhaeribacter aquaticus]
MGLVFNASGNFVSEKSSKKVHGTEVAVADLPATITGYISTNYAGATLVKAFKNGEGNYLVAIQNTESTVMGLAFDAAGTFTAEVTMKGKGGIKGLGKKGKSRKK